MSSQKGVHNRIHTLRGEQFRHLQNLRGSRSHLRSTNVHPIPSLPLRLLSLADPSANFMDHDQIPSSSQFKSAATTDTRDSQLDSMSSRPQAGPAPPKSWTLTTRKDVKGTASWRSQALSPVFSYLRRQSHSASASPPTASSSRGTEMDDYKSPLPGVPSLSLLCLQIVITTCTISEFRDDIMPYLPLHLRKDLIRFTAIHSPLTSSRLYALWEPFGHADGEMIVVGPEAVLKDDHFIRSHARSHPDDDIDASTQEQNWDWDADEIDTNVPLTTLILLNTTLSSSTLFSLPPTLTHIAFINLSIPIPLHRLPGICPMLVVLDLSYNSWLGSNFNNSDQGRGLVGLPSEPQQSQNAMVKTVADLGRVDWHRWNYLKVLRFRGNYVPDGFMNKVNEGRWDDVDVVL